MPFLDVQSSLPVPRMFAGGSCALRVALGGTATGDNVLHAARAFFWQAAGSAQYFHDNMDILKRSN